MSPQPAGTSSSPLQTAIISAIVALFVCLLTSGVTIWKTWADAKAKRQLDIRFSRLEFKRRSLREFYAPLRALLRSNSLLFKAYGPTTWPEDPSELEEAVTLWQYHIKTTLKPTNASIAEIILHNSDLIHSDDDGSLYTDFVVHARSYQCFLELPNTRHALVGEYPKDINTHVDTLYMKVISEIANLERAIEN